MPLMAWLGMPRGEYLIIFYVWLRKRDGCVNNDPRVKVKPCVCVCLWWGVGVGGGYTSLTLNIKQCFITSSANQVGDFVRLLPSEGEQNAPYLIFFYFFFFFLDYFVTFIYWSVKNSENVPLAPLFSHGCGWLVNRGGVLGGFGPTQHTHAHTRTKTNTQEYTHHWSTNGAWNSAQRASPLDKRKEGVKKGRKGG